MIPSTYIPPRLEVFTYVVEKGFCQSVKARTVDGFSEINDETTENFTGEWF